MTGLREKGRRLEVVVSQGKLMLDKIPQIIHDKGLEPVSNIADPNEHETGCGTR